MSLLDERDHDAQVERRLRAMYGTVVPLLDERPPTLDALPEDVTFHQRSPRRTGVLVLVAASVVAVAGLVVAQRVSVPDRATTDLTSAVPASPDWYEPLRAPLPAGFDQLAVVQANEFGVSYVAFRTGSNQVLEIRLGLDPIFGGGAAVEPATFTDDAGEYSEVAGSVRLRTADDRTITVRCGPTPTTMGPAAPLGASMVSMCADPAQADPIDAAALRGIAAGLAAMPVDAIGNVVIKPIPAEVQRRVEVELPSLFGVQSTSVGDMYDGSARVSGWGDDLLAPSTVLTVIGNVFGPPPSSDDGAPSDVSANPPLLAAAGVTGLLFVSENTAVHVATTNPTDGMLNQMSQLLGDPGAIDRSLPAPDTIGSEPIDSDVGPDIVASPEQEYAVLAGDFPLKVADQFGITIDELVAYNEWTSVAEFPGVGGIVKIPPGTTELTAVTDTTVLGVVTDSEEAEAIAELLNGVPVPDGFDVAALKNGTTNDRYQFIVQVSGAVACAWLDQWFTGQETQDPDLQSAAAAALATSHTWPMLTEIADQGGWSDELWLHADAVNGGAGVMTGNGPSAPTRSEANSALGCHI
jgi:hypothetical protein